MLKAGIISQARMTSTRLPGKILIEIKDKPVLKYQTDRLQKSGIPIYIATTTNESDDPVEEFARKENLFFYRGDENNVLSRYYECALKHQLDVIVRVTSDCPLIDGDLIKEAIGQYMDEENLNLYLSNTIKRTYPRGFDFEIFSFALLEDAYKNAKVTSDLEHVTPYINQNKSGKVILKHIIQSADKSNIRITLDTPEDLELIKKLIEEYDAEVLNAKRIIDLFDKNPELLKINAHIEQKKI